MLGNTKIIADERINAIVVSCGETDAKRIGELVQKLLPLRTLNNLGPAIYVDAKRYVSRRERDDITESRLLYEIFYAFFLPQFEGIDEHKAVQLYRLVAKHLDPPEQAEARRVIAELLGDELVA